ncbi:MAG TPA: LPP20 family lipoprotein [Gammaproteobacteria bacterium]|nr:LPP20 family lipoprotein [Gammaproteobacteria bacterium]
MMMSRRFARMTFIPAILLSLAACSSHTVVKSNLGIEGAPDWVNQGSQALNNDNQRLIHGIGSAQPMNDLSLQTSTADGRARAEVARVLSSLMRVVSQDYAASAGTGQDQQNQTSISRQIETITNQNVSGAQIIAHWRDPKSGAVWSLAELDMKNVKQMVAGSQQMNAGFKDYFASHADNLFDNNAKGGQP